MNFDINAINSKTCWFVGSAFDGKNDQTQRFIQDGIWEIKNPNNKDASLVRSMSPSDFIAIKSTYVRKNNLPFDNRGNAVSVMAIKAIGKVISNNKDGFSVRVDWQEITPPKEWYFYTYRSTIWRVLPGDWEADGLIKFTFKGQSQDLDRFRNAPFWRGRYGDSAIDNTMRFPWTQFYEVFADKLMTYRNRRNELIEIVNSIAEKVDCMSVLQDQYEKGVPGGPLKDICPFTTFGVFNRGLTTANRKIIAQELANQIGISISIPDSFEGIPILNNQKSWFFSYSYNRLPDDIDVLWDVFAKAIAFSGSDDEQTRTTFITAYNTATQRRGIGWNLTMGLYWIRPWNFPTLDSQSQRYINKKLNIEIGKNGPKGRCNADDYLTLLNTLEARFQEDGYSVHSFPELSLAAWQFQDTEHISPDIDEPKESDEEDTDKPEIEVQIAPIQTYSIDDILKDGCFVAREKLEKILERLRVKKNLILQGPPGTGKTWLAKRLAFALMGQRDDTKIRAVQFHPNLSYEDFIRGWRPAGDGKLALVDGPFVEIIKSAAKDPKEKLVVVIEEINRGNPAQIFGEMLTLLEVDKRTPDEALELSYKRSDGERVFIPGNLYVIGTMNIADRSLALVDLALRRRFAFIDLEPEIGKAWQDWVQSNCGITTEILIEIGKRINSLNNEISADNSLGPQFRIGHSYVTPPFGIPIIDAREWFRQVVDTEIGPLLDEYWFDALGKAQKVKERLLEGF